MRMPGRTTVARVHNKASHPPTVAHQWPNSRSQQSAPSENLRSPPVKNKKKATGKFCWNPSPSQQEIEELDNQLEQQGTTARKIKFYKDNFVMGQYVRVRMYKGDFWPPPAMPLPDRRRCR